MSDTKTLTVRQAALRLGNTQKYVRDLLYEGKLAGSRKVGSRWLIPTAALEARLKARQKAQGQPEQAP